MRGRPGPNGFTLFEVLLALAVVGLAMAVISQVVWSGMENARMTQDMVQAELLAESVMAEVLAGVRPFESVEDSTFDEDSGLEEPDRWVFSIEATPLETTGLTETRVTVQADSDKTSARSFSLVRWVFVPETDTEAETDTETQTNAATQTQTQQTSEQ
jgi:type II secretion system protein I